MRFYLSLFFLIAGVYMLTTSGRLGLSDGFAMFNVTQSIWAERSLSSSPCDPQLDMVKNQCVPGTDGRYYAGYGLLPSILAVPPVITAKLISTYLHMPSMTIMKVSVVLFTSLISALLCVILASWILRLGYSRRTAALAACILAFASPLWNFGVKGFYSEPYFILALLLASYFISAPRIPLASALSGLAFGAACACRINGAILLPVFLLSLAVQDHAYRAESRQRFLRDATHFLSAFAIWGALIAWANFARFGSPFKTGYQLAYPSLSALFSTPFFRGLYELLFSGEVGLLIFVPWIVLAFACFPYFAQRHRAESVLCGGLFLFNLFFFAKYDSWHGGWVAGPRLLLPTLPFLLVVLAPYLERLQDKNVTDPFPLALKPALMAAFVTVSFLIQIVGVFYPSERYYVAANFYEHKSEKPWWAGSILLASFDFFSKPTAVVASGLNAVELRDSSDHLSTNWEEARILESIPESTTEDEYLHSFPNSINLNTSNLMIVKMRLLGLPSRAVYGYIISAVLLTVFGIVGTWRYADKSAS